jgi:hypothetical protein
MYNNASDVVIVGRWFVIGRCSADLICLKSGSWICASTANTSYRFGAAGDLIRAIEFKLDGSVLVYPFSRTNLQRRPYVFPILTCSPLW